MNDYMHDSEQLGGPEAEAFAAHQAHHNKHVFDSRRWVHDGCFI
jgi:hypothetical protein